MSTESTPQLQFSDNEDFYRQLHETLRRSSEVLIETPFRTVDELPPRLDALCRGPRLRTSWSGPFVAGAMLHAAWSPNFKSLYVIAGAGAGAAIGGVVGGPVGMAAGALIGTATGAVAALVTEDSYEMIFEIDPQRRLRIRLRKRPEK